MLLSVLGYDEGPGADSDDYPKLSSYQQEKDGEEEERPKVGIRNFSPHLRSSALLRTTNSIAELRTKKVAEMQLRTFKI